MEVEDLLFVGLMSLFREDVFGCFSLVRVFYFIILTEFLLHKIVEFSAFMKRLQVLVTKDMCHVVKTEMNRFFQRVGSAALPVAGVSEVMLRFRRIQVRV